MGIAGLLWPGQMMIFLPHDLEGHSVLVSRGKQGPVPSNAALVVDREDGRRYFSGMMRNKMLTC
jgi:hypothetical protein